MDTVYEKHDKHFSHVRAAAILDKEGNYIAKIAIKFPAKGEGRLHAYLHVFSAPMVFGYMSGYGYDKASAAVASAADELEELELEDAYDDPSHMVKINERIKGVRAALVDCNNNGQSWETALHYAGYVVLSVL